MVTEREERRNLLATCVTDRWFPTNYLRIAQPPPCFRPHSVLMYTNNDRQVVTPQLRRLAGRHARYFDYSLEGPWGPCREMRRSARENPRVRRYFLSGEAATEQRCPSLRFTLPPW